MLRRLAPSQTEAELSDFVGKKIRGCFWDGPTLVLILDSQRVAFGMMALLITAERSKYLRIVVEKGLALQSRISERKDELVQLNKEFEQTTALADDIFWSGKK
jgi:hypothetical protein